MNQKNKKVVYFVHCYPPALGGLERLSEEMVSLISKNGHKVDVITGQGSTLDSYKNFSNWENHISDPSYIHRLPVRTFVQRLANKLLNKIVFITGLFSPWYFGPILSYNQKVIDIIKSADVLIGSGMPTMMFYDAYRFAKKFHKKLILIPAYHDVSYYNRSATFQSAFSFADKILYLSPLEKRNLQNHYRINKVKFKKFSFCTYTKQELQLAESKYKKNILRLEDKLINGNTLTIGFIGQITLRKNFKFFVELVDKISPVLKNQGINIRLLFAGVKTNSSPQVEALFSGINCKTVFIYNFLNKNEIHKQLDIFVNPSEEESLGLVNYDALMYGLPVFVNKKSAFASLKSRKKLFYNNKLPIKLLNVINLLQSLELVTVEVLTKNNVDELFVSSSVDAILT